MSLIDHPPGVVSSQDRAPHPDTVQRVPSPERKTPFVSVSLTPAARAELRRFAADIVPHAGRAVSLSEALIAALRVADENREAVVHELTRDTT